MRGPSLFLLFIDDLFSIGMLAHVRCYADDTTLYLNGKALPKLITEMNQDLGLLRNWITENHLSVDVEKSQVIVLRELQKTFKRGTLVGKIVFCLDEVPYAEDVLLLGSSD